MLSDRDKRVLKIIKPQEEFYNESQGKILANDFIQLKNLLEE
jgi:hypothetical protein